MGLHERRKEEYEKCLVEKARSGELPKGSALNAHRLSEICGDDPRTAYSHVPGLIGLELVGPNYRGKLRWLNTEAGPWAIVDPPSDTWMDKAPTQKEESDMERDALGVGLLVGGIAVGVILLVGLAVRQGEKHVCSWSPLLGADSWVGVCQRCGARGWSLNDQSAPIHFTPVSS